MRKVLDICRCDALEAPSRRQRFVFETDDGAATVASALRALNERPDLRDEDGNEAAPIRWECSCLQRKCGACAMVVNGVPRVACDVRLASLRGERVTLDPLRTFPVVADLVVDRGAVFDRLGELEVWLEGAVTLPVRRGRGAIAYEASRCLQCGCCLEVCPNFSIQGAFGGMAVMTPLSRLLAEATDDDRARLARKYREGVFAGCGKSFACRDVCPAEIDIPRLMSRSNAAALWRRA